MLSLLTPNPQGVLQISATADYEIALSLVLPTYQEKHNIELIVEQLAAKLDHFLPGAYELIVVDDDSPDLTWSIAAELTAQYPQLRVIRRVDERGSDQRLANIPRPSIGGNRCRFTASA
jgi:dolichol-phosphate mannosyltransferase